MPKIFASNLQEHRAETNDKLLDAFGELVMARGYTDTSLADVAAHAGLARTAIYNYFPDRESLLFAWTDREVNRTLARLEREVGDAGSFAEKLRAFVRCQLFEFTARHLPPGKEVMQFLRPETYERFMSHVEPVEKLLRDIIGQGAEAGEFGEVDPEATVPLVMACIGAERTPLAKREHDVDSATERVTTFLLRALAPAKPAKAPAAPRKRKPSR